MLRQHSAKIEAMPASLKAPDPSQPIRSLRDVLAFNVRLRRVEKKLSQEQLGFAAGLDRTFISQVERARINVSLDNIEKIAMSLDVPASELLKWPEL